MSFDFAKWKADAAAKDKNPTLMLLLAGAQGSGKSYTSGTFGVPTLYLHGTAEAHGPSQAAVTGGDLIVPHNWDLGHKTPTDAYVALVKLLSDDTLKDHFGAVIIDGATDLTYGLIRETEMFRQKCTTTKGAHDSWREGEATLDLLKPIMKALQKLKAAGVHTVVTMILDVQSVDGAGGLSVVKPNLPTYGITTNLVPQFDDIAMIGEVMDHPDLEKPAHLLQFRTSIKRISKDAKENVKSIFHITPRVTGVRKEDMPDFFKADLGILAAFKKKQMEGK